VHEPAGAERPRPRLRPIAEARLAALIEDALARGEPAGVVAPRGRS
jgi:hypothetical protein